MEHGPALSGSPLTTFTVNGTEGAIRLPAGNPLVAELYGDGVLSLGLASTNESSNGWAYFAKKEFDAAKGPCLTFAHGAPFTILEVDAIPTEIEMGGTGLGMVTLNAPAPAGGAVVSLSTSDQDLALVPGTVTVPQGERSATFTITAGEWWTGDVEISGTLEGITRRKMVSIVYGGWW